MTVFRTDARMSDGRAMHYFDGTPGRVPPPDTREPVDVGNGSVMRFDVLTGEWVTIAAHRMSRTHLPPADECPLCPTRPGAQPSEIPAPDYEVVVFDNRFPSFAPAGPDVPDAVDGDPLWPQRPAVGRCEVVCFTAAHDTSFSALPVSRVRTVVEAWADRTAWLSAQPGVEQVVPFENRGAEIGVTLQHPHGQVYAYPYVTPRTVALLDQAQRYAARTGGHLLTDVLEAERRSGTRIVSSGTHWTAYVPVAARWPIEVHLAPQRDVPDLAALDEAERSELVTVYLDLLRRLDRYQPGVDRLPYIAGWHQAPVHERRELGRLHLQVFSVLRAPGKIKYLAGSESGMGAWVNDTTPERIADRLRAVGP